MTNVSMVKDLHGACYCCVLYNYLKGAAAAVGGPGLGGCVRLLDVAEERTRLTRSSG